MRKSALLGALLALVACRTADAQDLRTAERLLDSLALRADRATAALAAYDDSVARRAQRLDTLQFGPLRVAAEPEFVDEAREVGLRVVDSLRGRLRESVSRVGALTLVVRAETDQRGAKVRGARIMDVIALGNAGAELRGIRTRATAEALEGALRDVTLGAVLRATDAYFFSWIGSVVPTDSVHPSEWARDRLSLASSSTSVGLRCFDGDIAACRLALGIYRTTDPVTEWYDASRRLQIVRSNNDLARRLNADATAACVGGADSACVVVMHLMRFDRHAEALSPRMRQTLVRFALQLGGADAMARLIEAPPGHMARLEAASGLPGDTLVARWQASVRNTRAPSRDLDAETTLVTVGWLLALGFVSTRSSRWR